MLTGPALSRFRKRLLAWFAQAQRDLPWRRTKDPYRIWISEIMLQQTRVAAALPYYEKFVADFPDFRSLAAAQEERVLRRWAGLGYYSRARNLQRAAQEIVERHNSRFPDARDRALELPGVGQYTAAAVLSIAYEKPLAVLDGNVARVLARLKAIRGDLRSPSQWAELQRTADTLLAPQRPGDWNQAMMELGATVCTPRSPQCLLCSVSEFCEARRKGLAAEIPEKRVKRRNEEVTLAAIVLLDRQGRTLLLPPAKKPDEGINSPVDALMSRMWHFPTIRVQAEPEAESRRFAAKLFGRRAGGTLTSLQRVRHTVTYRRITVHPFRLEVGELPAIASAQMLSLADVSSVPISNLTRKISLAAEKTPSGIRKPSAALSFPESR
jgi:A/G-specific adenine glycosylase